MAGLVAGGISSPVLGGTSSLTRRFVSHTETWSLIAVLYSALSGLDGKGDWTRLPSCRLMRSDNAS